MANAGLCSDMIPTDHNGGVSLATDMDNPPYTITTSSDMYYAGGTVTGKVQLYACIICDLPLISSNSSNNLGLIFGVRTSSVPHPKT